MFRVTVKDIGVRDKAKSRSRRLGLAFSGYEWVIKERVTVTFRV